MDKVDKSKCQKSKRGDMTCYTCNDGKGFNNEECVFVTDPNLKIQSTEASTLSIIHVTDETRENPSILNNDLKLLTNNRKTRETEKNLQEPYEYNDETRQVYDKIWNMQLPAFMVKKTQDEIEFDKKLLQ